MTTPYPLKSITFIFPINSTKRSRDEQKIDPDNRSLLLVLRLVTLVILVTLLTMHVRSLRVFRFEQIVSGGILVTYSIAVVGLVLSAGVENSGGRALQAYLCASGAALLTMNAAVIWHRWRRASEMTQVIAELLLTLGLRIRRQVYLKVIFSAMAAAALLIDLVFTTLFTDRRT